MRDSSNANFVSWAASSEGKNDRYSSSRRRSAIQCESTNHKSTWLSGKNWCCTSHPESICRFVSVQRTVRFRQYLLQFHDERLNVGLQKHRIVVTWNRTDVNAAVHPLSPASVAIAAMHQRADACIQKE